jgi:hypothetical protein
MQQVYSEAGTREEINKVKVELGKYEGCALGDNEDYC